MPGSRSQRPKASKVMDLGEKPTILVKTSIVSTTFETFVLISIDKLSLHPSGRKLLFATDRSHYSK